MTAEEGFTAVAVVQRVSDSRSVVGTLYDCDACAAVVTRERRQQHREWHERLAAGLGVDVAMLEDAPEVPA